ncbi:hypothetical protein D3C85_912210 [compost metagenome]
MRQPQRQIAFFHRVGRRHQAAKHRVAAFAVQDLARLQVALGGGDHIAVPTGRRAGGFTPQAHAGHADAQFQADQVIGLVHGGVVAAGVGDQTVFLEAAAHIVAVGGQRHVDAPAQVAKHRAAVALQR